MLSVAIVGVALAQGFRRSLDSAALVRRPPPPFPAAAPVARPELSSQALALPGSGG